MVCDVRASPNFDERVGEGVPDILLLHYTGMATGAEALARLSDPLARVSSHYVVEEDGRIFQLVPEALRAWHAGAGSWEGRGDVNSRSIGIEIVNPGHEHGYRPFPSVQIASVIELCRECVDRWRIAPRRVLAHSDTAPDRKQDPGELFPWDQLSRAGIGLAPAAKDFIEGSALSEGATGADVVHFQATLTEFGYGVETTGTFDRSTVLATTAFQRHYRTSRIDGAADAATRAALDAMIAGLA